MWAAIAHFSLPTLVSNSSLYADRPVTIRCSERSHRFQKFSRVAHTEQHSLRVDAVYYIYAFFDLLELIFSPPVCVYYFFLYSPLSFVRSVCYTKRREFFNFFFYRMVLLYSGPNRPNRIAVQLDFNFYFEKKNAVSVRTSENCTVHRGNHNK